MLKEFLLAFTLLITVPSMVLASATSVAPCNPALMKFNNAITFYASFDGHITADLSNGKGVAIGNATDRQYGKGVCGQALQGQGNGLIYDAKDNIDLTRSGSLILWVAPSGEWTDQDAPVQLSLAFVHDQGTSLLLARQGGKSNDQALMTIYGSNVNNAATRALVKNKNSKSWKKGQWHLLAVNWANGYVELSVDGSLFKKDTAKLPDAPPSKNTHETIAIAGRSTSKSPYLVDELMILNRPLTNDEIKVLFESKFKTTETTTTLD